MNQERYSRAFSFVLNDGREVFPIMMKSRNTGKIAFRISQGGKGGNTIAAGEQVDEQTMIEKVTREGYAVRCASLDGKQANLLKMGQRAVKEVKWHHATSAQSHT
jgi:hypothetical protein